MWRQPIDGPAEEETVITEGAGTEDSALESDPAAETVMENPQTGENNFIYSINTVAK